MGACAGNTGIETCTAGSWGGDTCNPLAGAVAEICDGLDNDCDGQVDEGCGTVPVCGNGICEGDGENCFSCALDCRCSGPNCSKGCCGDEICSGNENASNCPVDCGG